MIPFWIITLYISVYSGTIFTIPRRTHCSACIFFPATHHGENRKLIVTNLMKWKRVSVTGRRWYLNYRFLKPCCTSTCRFLENTGFSNTCRHLLACYAKNKPVEVQEQVLNSLWWCSKSCTRNKHNYSLEFQCSFTIGLWTHGLRVFANDRYRQSTNLYCRVTSSAYVFFLRWSYWRKFYDQDYLIFGGSGRKK